MSTALRDGLSTGLEEGWRRVGTLAVMFSAGSCYGVEIDGRRLGFFLVQGTVYAIDDICTHGNARLSEGELEAFEIECPLHAGVFDIRNGRALCAPLTRDVTAHRVRSEDDQVYVRIEAKS
jgi:naphthalene 1,2-dioxygenase system ferredoxin subunit